MRGARVPAYRYRRVEAPRPRPGSASSRPAVGRAPERAGPSRAGPSRAGRSGPGRAVGARVPPARPAGGSGSGAAWRGGGSRSAFPERGVLGAMSVPAFIDITEEDQVSAPGEPSAPGRGGRAGPCRGAAAGAGPAPPCAPGALRELGWAVPYSDRADD